MGGRGGGLWAGGGRGGLEFNRNVGTEKLVWQVCVPCPLIFCLDVCRMDIKTNENIYIFLKCSIYFLSL